MCITSRWCYRCLLPMAGVVRYRCATETHIVCLGSTTDYLVQWALLQSASRQVMNDLTSILGNYVITHFATYSSTPVLLCKKFPPTLFQTAPHRGRRFGAWSSRLTGNELKISMLASQPWLSITTSRDARPQATDKNIASLPLWFSFGCHGGSEFVLASCVPQGPYGLVMGLLSVIRRGSGHAGLYCFSFSAPLLFRRSCAPKSVL